MSFLSEADCSLWQEHFLAYSTLDEIGAAMMDGQDDEEDEEEEDYDPSGTPGTSPAAGASNPMAGGRPTVTKEPQGMAFSGVTFSTEVLKEAVALTEKVTDHVDSMLARGCAMYADALNKLTAEMPDSESTKKGSPKRKAAEVKAKLAEEAPSAEVSAEGIDDWKSALLSAQSQLKELEGEGKKEAKEVAPYLEIIEMAIGAADPFFAQIAAEEEQGAGAIAHAVDQAANFSDLYMWVGGSEQKDAFNASLKLATELRGSGKSGEACRELQETLRISLRAVVAGGGTRVGARQSSLHPQRWAGELDGIDPWGAFFLSSLFVVRCSVFMVTLCADFSVASDINSDDEYEE